MKHSKRKEKTYSQIRVMASPLRIGESFETLNLVSSATTNGVIIKGFEMKSRTSLSTFNDVYVKSYERCNA